MLATLLLVAQVTQKTGEVDVAAYLHAHREADRALTAGKNAEARAGFEKCLELAPKNATVAYGLACARAKAGEKDAALEWLARAVEWGYADAELALWDDDLASLRDDERFKSAIEAMRKVRGPSTSIELVRTFDKRAKSSPIDVSIDKAASRIAVGYSSGELVVLDAHSGEERARSKKLEGNLWAVAMRPNGQRVVALTYDGKVHFWRPDDPQELTSADGLREPEEDTGWPFGALVEFDPTGERVLVAGRDHGASLWTGAGTKLHAFDGSFGGFMGVVLAWNSDGTRIAASHESEIVFFDGKTGAPLDMHIATPSPAGCIAFDSNGKWIASGHADGRARLWDAHTLELLHESTPHDGLGEVLEISELSFSPDGARLALTTTSEVYAQVLEAMSLKVIYTSGYLEGRMGEPSGICWAPDSRRLWTAFVGGAMPIFEIDPASAKGSKDSGSRFIDGPPQPWLVRGRVPKASAGGVAVFTSYNAVTALDTKSGRVLWTHVNTGRDGVLFQSPGGWFDASFDDLAELAVYRGVNTDAGTPLTSLAKQLFDPKRVRAAKAGVALAPVKW